MGKTKDLPTQISLWTCTDKEIHHLLKWPLSTIRRMIKYSEKHGTVACLPGRGFRSKLPLWTVWRMLREAKRSSKITVLVLHSLAESWGFINLLPNATSITRILKRFKSVRGSEQKHLLRAGQKRSTSSSSELQMESLESQVLVKSNGIMNSTKYQEI